jgi:hypothetical protein
VRFDSITLEPLLALSTIDLGTSAAHPLMLSGWSADEREGPRSVVWSIGPRSTLALVLERGRDATVQIEARAYPPALPLEVSVLLDEQPVGSFRPTPDWHTYDIPLPERLFSAAGNVLELRFDKTVRPSERDPASADGRELAVRFDQVLIIP